LLGEVRPALATRVIHHRRHRHHHYHAISHLPAGPMYHAVLLMDADSGKVLYAENATMQWPPASMAKMMLLAVAEDQIRAGRVSYSDLVRISERAATTGGSRIGLHEGDVYPLGELMKAALIRSANDAAVAIAEKIGGSVEGCVRMMNQKARALGMDRTYYGTPDGLPPRPGHDVDYTTAQDLAILARSIILHTHLLRWSSMETAPFDGGRIMLHNTNHLVGRLDGCDGLKTGFTVQAGFNLTATAERGDMRLISVVLGAPSNPERFIQSARWLDWGFDNFSKVRLMSRGEALPVHVQLESGQTIQPVAENDVSIVLRKNQTPNVKVEYDVPPVLDRPLRDGEPIGQVLVMQGGEIMDRVYAVSPVAIGHPAATLSKESIKVIPSSGTAAVPARMSQPALVSREVVSTRSQESR
jgi:D-alanyl-D-alanine carboxypeptidase (penicillin-binding protein 5/6)